MASEAPSTEPYLDSWDQRKDRLCNQFEEAWSHGQRPKIEDYLVGLVEPRQSELLRELLELELEMRREFGEETSITKFEQRFPNHLTLVRAAFFAAVSFQPEQIGRFQVRRLLGKGGFGEVYLCYDSLAERDVAIKVARRDRLTTAEAEQNMLREARNVARLNHPCIVPLYDVGEYEGRCFLVFQFIDGMSLAELLQQGQVPQEQAAQLVARIADTLHHAHSANLFHRDIKPSNILLDLQGQPFLTDFGLAAREEDLPAEAGRCLGTYPYMAPEQVRGEGNRIDGRTDIYSLGVVLYELLCGRRPFLGSRAEVLDQILHRQPRPPRQIHPGLDPELERICLKALAKRMIARYLTAADLAADLRALAAPVVSSHQPAPTRPDEMPSPDSLPTQPLPPPPPPPVPVVPKVLQSFGQEDSGFFLRLLPGPRDRDGLPDSLRFWKTGIESRDPVTAFAVGLIYGPTGCGKSSLIKAGLLPRLSPTVVPVYVEATREDTEARLTRGLQNACPGLRANAPLPALFAALRRSGTRPENSKVLIVLDQFEQWLHGHGQDMENTELVAALRQANGDGVQVILMVRDDFWMSISRLFDCLEIDLDRARNARAVDLFDADHACQVLGMFGRAYGRLPAEPEELTREQTKFLGRAVAELSQDGRVVPVRLSLFADLMKDRPWTSAALAAVGGAEGVGIRFLEEAFTAKTSLPDLRMMEKPARRLLQALLPEGGTDIKGQMRSRQKLAEAAGLEETSSRFGRLLGILDHELHLITPTEAEPTEFHLVDTDPLSAPQPLVNPSAVQGAAYYQLTHDYLVPALREWLTRGETKHWRGRARLSLAEWAARWGLRRENRFLPSLPVYLYLCLGVPPRRRQPVEKSLLRAAGRHHALVWGSVLALLLFVGFAVRRHIMQGRAESVVASVLIAPPHALPQALENLAPLREVASPLLLERYNSVQDPHQKLHAALALMTCGESAPVQEYLLDMIATVPVSEGKNLINVLAMAPRQQLLSLLLERVQQAKDPVIKARYAITLMQIGKDLPGTDLLKLDPDPTYRSAFLLVYATWHGDLRPILPLLERCDNSGIRAGLCTAIGMVDVNELGVEEREAWKRVLHGLVESDGDAGTHSAAAWALSKWQEPLPSPKPTPGALPNRDWYVNRLGMTLLKVQPGRFRMGRSVAGDKRPWVEQARPFYACDREVTVGQFTRFLRDSTYEGPKPQMMPMAPPLLGARTVGLLAMPWGQGPFQTATALIPARTMVLEKQDASMTEEAAASTISWNDAILFCNWLSDQDNRKRCYRPSPGGGDWECDFDADGYRLPRSAEWEYLCRAGTTTTFSFGNDPGSLPSYAWTFLNSDGVAHPGGQKIPNAWGFFDMHGNLEEWCWDRGSDKLDNEHVLRGGNFFTNQLGFAESGYARITASPNSRTLHIGFRVVHSMVDGKTR